MLSNKHGNKFYLACNILKNWSSYFIGLPHPVPVGYVVVGLTFLCNAKCIMCNIHGLYKNNPHLFDNELDLSATLERLKESATIRKINHIDLTGGEPFLKEGLRDFITGLFRLPNINLVTMNTNGLNSGKIVDDISSILKSIHQSKCFAVSVSMDGIGEVHDKIRGVAGAFGKIENTLNGLKELRSRYPNFTIRSNAVIQPANISHSIELKDYWRKHAITGAFSVIQTPLYNSDQEDECGINGFSKDDVERVKVIEPKSKGMNQYLENNFIRPLHCFAGYASLFIDPFGAVYPCNFLAGDEKYRMGNIKDNTIDSIWTSRFASDIRAKVKTCPYTNCWNGCEVDQTLIQFEPVDRLIRAMSFGLLSYYKIKGMKYFK